MGYQAGAKAEPVIPMSQVTPNWAAPPNSDVARAKIIPMPPERAFTLNGCASACIADGYYDRTLTINIE